MSGAADDGVAAFAKGSIARGSKSFSAAARLFDAPTREGVVMLYAWCRHCDDVVDGQEGGRGAVPSAQAVGERLAALRRDTHAAVAGDVAGLDPAFAALAAVVHRHAIPPALLDAHLAGFAMDAEGRRYRTLDELLAYCWHVAGVVGVMMARIMGVRDAATLDRAMDLGLAFQLTNIARDVVEDAAAGRVYVPLDWLAEEGIVPAALGEPGLAAALGGSSRAAALGEPDWTTALGDPGQAAAVARLRARLVAAAEPYYRSADLGIDRLPRRSAWAIATAARVYRRIGVKLVGAGEAAHGERVFTTGTEKLAAVAGAGWTALRFRDYGTEPRDLALWPRPAVE